MIHETPVAVSKDTIKKDLDYILRRWTDGSKHVISHYLSPIQFREKVAFVGTDEELIDWVERFPYKVGAIYVVSERKIVYSMEKLRPELQFFKLVVHDAFDPKE